MKSMTGFSTAEATQTIGVMRAEIKSVNQKGLDVQVRAPRACAPFESDIDKLARAKLTRGKVFISLHLETVSYTHLTLPTSDLV